MHEIAKGNAIQRVTFLRWHRRGWEDNPNRSFGNGYLQINFTDDETGTTIKNGFVIPNTPEGEALIHSIAALNGLEMLEWHGEGEAAGMWYQEWDTGPETPRLHKWVGYED